MNCLPSNHIVFALIKFARRHCLTVAAFVCMTAGATPARATESDLSISQNLSFNFGKIVPGQTGTITIVAGSLCSRSASPSSLVVASSPCSAARFTVTDPDEKNPDSTYTYTVTLPSSVTLTCAGGGTMTLSNFTTSPLRDGNGDVSFTGACISSITGLSCPLYVGATLTINSAPSSSGSITGTYDVTVNFKN